MKKENLREQFYNIMQVEPKDSSQFLIAKEILFSLGYGKKLNSSDIAKNTNCSKPTVIRFAQSFGFEGFREFKKEIDAQDANYFFISKTKTYQESYLDYNNLLKQLIMELEKETPVLIEIAKLISKKKRVFLFSSSEQMSIIYSFASKLSFLGIEAFHSPVAQLFFLNTIEQDDITLFLSSGPEDKRLTKIWNNLNAKAIRILFASPSKLIKYINSDFFIEIKVGPNLLRAQLQTFLYNFLLDQLYNLIVYSDEKFLEKLDAWVYWR